MVLLLRLVLLVCLLQVGASALAAELPRLSLSEAQLAKPVAVQRSLLLEDPAAELTAREALERIGQAGVEHQGTPRIGYSGSAWWAAFVLDAPAAARLNLIIGDPFLDDIEVWLYDRDQLIAPLYSGDTRPFLERGEPYPHFMLSLPRLGQGPHTLLLRVQSATSISLPMQLVAAEQASQLIARGWLQSGLVQGVLLSLLLFYLIKYGALREARLAYFCLTALSAVIYSAAQQGLLGLLMPFWLELPVLLVDLSGPGMLIFSTLFISTALELRLGRLRLVRDGLIAAVAAVALCSLVLGADARLYRILNALVLAVGLFQLLLVLLGIHQRRPYAIGYLLCWSAALLLMTLVPVGRMGLIALPPGFQYFSAYLPAISMLLFGALLGKQLEQVREALVSSQAQAIDHLERYQALFRSASEGIFRCSRDGQLLEANPSLARFLKAGEGPQALAGTAIGRLLGFDQWQHLVGQLSPQQSSQSLECRLHDLDGQPHWVHLSLHLRPAQDCIEGIVVDLTERRALEQRLKHLAAHDSLTGLLNRRELERLLKGSLSGEGARRFSHLLCLDLDQFKQVNDLCGHSAGDQLLRQLAVHLLKNLPPRAELARLGGDEFAVLLEQADAATAEAHAERLRDAVERFVFTWQGRAFRVCASIGLLALEASIGDWETALSWADSASQQAKHQGRNRVQLFNPEDGALLEHQRQLQWLTRLREGLEHDHFELHYQAVMPLCSASAGLHYEVLLRYRDPASGELIAPGRFLPAAERYGLLGAIDCWVIRALLQWLADNPEHLAQLVQVNLNLSASSLQDEQIHRLLQDELRRHGLPPAKLCIEITEMVALGELGVSAQWLRQLREQGLKVALDDFGSGFASYAYLRHLPLDFLKIDGSFVRGLEADPINQAMVRSMQQIARQLGLRTVAEFVESQATLDCLRSLEIDYAQGYLIGRPQPLAELADQALGDVQPVADAAAHRGQ